MYQNSYTFNIDGKPKKEGSLSDAVPLTLLEIQEIKRDLSLIGRPKTEVYS
jgi:hypothetical protein